MSNPGPASTATTAYGFGGGSPAQIGDSSSSKVGFYGATASTQPASASQAATLSTAAVSISATQWGFATSTQADAIVTLVNRLRADLVTLGLIKGSA